MYVFNKDDNIVMVRVIYVSTYVPLNGVLMENEMSARLRADV